MSFKVKMKDGPREIENTNQKNNEQEEYCEDDLHPDVEHYENLILEKNKEINGLLLY